MMQDSTEQILRTLNATLTSKKLYPAGHPSVAAPLGKFQEVVLKYLEEENDRLIVGIVDDTLIIEDAPVATSQEQYPDVIAHLKKNGVGAIVFKRSVTRQELGSLLDILTQEVPVEPEELEKELKKRGILHIDLKLLPKEKKSFLEVHSDAVQSVKNAMNEIRMGKIPSSKEVKNVATDMTDMIFTDSNAMMGLAMIKSYDEYLYNHSVNVAIFGISLGRAMNHDEKDLHIIGVAALLHDIGKTGVSENIIRKPGNLSAEEWEKVKQHPVHGCEITKRMDGVDSKVSTIVFEHHVRYDHSGYPAVGQELALHPLSLIISVADAYDALTTLRVYQKAYSPVEAIKILRDLSGKHFDPGTIQAFEDMIGIYPVGTMVRLSTNEVGVVTKANTTASERPVVKVLFDANGNMLDKPPVVDLSQKEFEALSIVGTVDPLSRNMDLGALFAKEVSG